jgi:osmotically-inducible protein OsmY
MKTTILSRSTRWMILAAALGTVSVSPLTATPQQSPEGSSEISAFIKMDVKGDRQMTGASINATTEKGIVILEGSALSLDQSERAAAYAMATKGVRAVINHVRIVKPTVSDDVLGDRILHSLAKSPALDAAKIQVRVQDQRAFLSGEVGTWDEQELARSLAAETPGVREIDNRLAVNFETIRSDGAIKAQILHLVKHDPLYDGVRVDVSVKDGVARISGEVGSHGEKERLIRGARVTGVMDVKGDDIVVNTDLALDGLIDKNFTHAETLASLSDALAMDTRVEGSHINSTLAEGIITLTGTTPTSIAKTAAESTARGLPGVIGVSNELIIMGETGDAATAANISAALKRDQTLAYLGLSADCKNGICTIGGQAFSNDEKSKAAILAAAIPGVKALKNEITVDQRAAAIRDDRTSPDSQIAEGIRKQIFWTPGVKSKEVQVSVSKGKALLSGTVKDKQAADTVVKNAYKGGAHEVDNRLAISDQ